MVFEPVPQIIDRGVAHKVVLNGALTSYWQYGNDLAPLAVLVHGFRGDHHGLELIAQSLLKDFRVIVPDLPGFGHSESIANAEHGISTYSFWLVEFLDALGEVPSVLVGHSFGSIVCSYAVAARPEICRKLSLINPISEPALEGSQRFVSALASIYYSVGAKLPEAIGFRWLRSKAVTRASSRFMMRTPDKQLRHFINAQHDAYFGAFSSRTTVLEAYQASITETAARYSYALQVPTQLIVAEDDDLGSVCTAQKMYSQLAQGSIEIIPEVGHLIHYETPALAASLISQFAKESE